MAGQLNGGGQTDPTSWWNIVATSLGILGAPVLLQKLFEHFFGHKKTDAEAEKAEAEAEATLKDANTREFRVLKDAWADRMNDLLAEVHRLRDEVISLRQAYDTQQRNHSEQMNALQTTHAEQMAALREELQETRRSHGRGARL